MADIKYLIEVDEKGAVTKIQAVEGALGNLKETSGKAGSAFSGMWKQFVSGQIIMEGLKKAFGAVTGFVTDSIKGAMEEEKAEKNLATALDLTGRSRSAMMPGLMSFAMEIHNATKFTHEEAQESMTLLAQLTNLDSKGLKTATRGAVGLASVMGIDLHSATMLVAKAMEGNTGALARYGIKVDDTLPKEQQRNDLLEKLSVFYGRATAETDTFGGRITQLGKAWDEVKEAVGGAITNNEAIKKLIGEVTDKINALAGSDDFKLWLSMIADGISAVVKFAGDLLGKLADIENFILGSTGYKKYIKEETDLHGAIQRGISIMDLKKKAMEEGIIKTGEWARMLQKYGGDYKLMMSAIAAGKEGPELKQLFGDLKTKTDELGKAAAGAGPKINETGKALGGAAEKTKTLAEQLGIVTRIELENKLKLYKTALDQYKDSNQLTTKAKDDLLKKIKDLEIELGIYKGYLSDIKNELLTGVIPSTRGFKTELVGLPEDLKNLGTEGKSSMEIIGDSAEEVTTNTRNYFADMYLNITSGWGSLISTYLQGGQTFKDFFKGMIGEIKKGFADMIGEMIRDWLQNFVKNIIKGGTDAATGVASSFSNLGTTIGSVATSIGTIITTLASAVATAIATIATGIGTALVTLATAIASAATILAAAAAAIITVGALAVALYAAFKIVGGIIDKLFGGGGKSGDVTYWLKLIWENTQNLWNTMTWLPNIIQASVDCLNTLKTIGWDLKPALVSRFDKANAYLKQILDAIRGLPQAQGGGYFERPALVHVAERGPEWVLNRQQITNIMHAAPTAGSSSSMNLSLTFNINAINREGMKEEVQQRILPIIIDTIKTNTRQLGRKLNMAQGIA